MISLLIAVIYLAFISLGLPDSLLGSAWPSLSVEIGASLSSAGIITMTISICTVISSLFSARLMKRFSEKWIIAISTLMTAFAVFMFSRLTHFYQFLILAIPYGLGAGAIDACLNNYVACHLSSRHMNWLHCFWGIGACFSPYVMGYAIANLNGWQDGYVTVSIVQLVISVIMFLSFPLWDKAKEIRSKEDDNFTPIPLSIKEVLKLKYAKATFISFLCYCGFEQVSMVWASSYFSKVYELEDSKAAMLGSLFLIGMTLSRAICGIISNKIGDKNLIRIGQGVVLVSSILLIIPFNNYYLSLVSYILLGLGSGPIYPSIVHETPTIFKKEYTASIVGIQMAFAYLGCTFMPYLFGKVAELTNIKLLPVLVCLLVVVMILLTENINFKRKIEN